MSDLETKSPILARRSTARDYNLPQVKTISVALDIETDGLAAGFSGVPAARGLATGAHHGPQQRWLREHAPVVAALAGRWIAVSAHGVVGVGDSLAAVRRAADERGIARHDVILLKVPDRSAKRVVSARWR